MHEVFAFVEQDRGKLDACSAMVVVHALRAARSRPDTRVTAVLNLSGEANPSPTVAALGRQGVRRVLIVAHPEGDIEPSDVQPVMAQLDLARCALLLAPATRLPSMLAACIAARAGLPLVQDCVAIRAGASGWRFDVATAGGMAIVEAALDAPGPAAVLMPLRDVAPLDIEAVEPAAMEIVTKTAGPKAAREGVRLAERVKVRREEMTLAEANVIVSGGRGLGGAEGFEPLKRLADMMGGHLGASRVATDLGWVDRQHLVGMSGSTVRPALYLACGISGAPHHLMGMRDATLIVALNTDERAPLLSLAHHAFVGDAGEIIPKVIDRLSGIAA
ncbi:Electron transfer flavoprotein large subunit [Variovorax sp. SRS16]|uniref:electron transfer flavoprotein subunit alpha/FixB family protein n=1 Tax=Variovorax sp. SRS16 TaxID=282217 RepID=UPI0013187AEC|nr:electron transfer flavoprotein subunit alpha/FixB family protein [Variovorax sp. SRS16]VTU16857.1 Electron transfer flavoprotein large subunit [Variovorax sp. SRS16]